jgi:hypothetical protein
MSGLVEHESVRRISLRDCVSLYQEFRLNVRPIIPRCTPPAWYAAVRGKSSNELLAYMWLDQGREEWIMFHPDEATAEVVELFDDA